MQQIAEWLEKLGMSEYAERFAESNIDMTCSANSRIRTLRIGVSLGHRRKMLAAIREFAVRHRLQERQASSQPEPKPQETAERRQVTVMFSDLVGSTALSARMDPEVLVRSFRPIRSASPRRCSVRRVRCQVHGRRSARVFWLSRRRMRTMPSGRCAQGLSWSQRWR